jgi:hypothetical protein
MRWGWLNAVLALNWFALAVVFTWREQIVPERFLPALNAESWRLVCVVAWVLAGYNLLRVIIARRRARPTVPNRLESPRPTSPREHNPEFQFDSPDAKRTDGKP